MKILKEIPISFAMATAPGILSIGSAVNASSSSVMEKCERMPSISIFGNRFNSFKKAGQRFKGTPSLPIPVSTFK